MSIELCFSVGNNIDFVSMPDVLKVFLCEIDVFDERTSAGCPEPLCPEPADIDARCRGMCVLSPECDSLDSTTCDARSSCKWLFNQCVGQDAVSCGGHVASSCSMCPCANEGRDWYGALFCNGSCAWDEVTGQCAEALPESDSMFV